MSRDPSRQMAGDGVRIHLEKVPEIAVPESGKRRFIVSLDKPGPDLTMMSAGGMVKRGLATLFPGLVLIRQQSAP